MSRNSRKKERQAQQENLRRTLDWKYEGDQAEKKFRLTLYYKVCGLLTIIVGILYAIIRVLRGRNYFLINTSIEHWVWYALVIGALLIIGRYITEMPKKKSTQKSVRILVAIGTLCLLVLTFVQCLSRIDTGFFKYKIFSSDDGSREAVVMCSKLYGEEPEDGSPAEVDVLYKAYPRINRFFYDGSDYANMENMIWIVNNEKATLDDSWSEDGKTFTLTTNASADDIKVLNLDGESGKKPLDTVVVEFE